ncbi:cyclic peptide export ABC transporter [Singulisphaera acidiphila]|uniref:Cyclic peptide transporter n=1 Tax=Singulisphaera acidiphila (strain ATCC BAA-1392 / DSM 18658 / VKM B-2454 / MOB10) TaxID=886293 RepID=L0DPC7_SINAD|nr:cyclic peptide export ABC transporter [Singulisphaera acidiphila]AGA31112.1 cyclic peptide transporter [Singulisphaera acidiphila DSM 18658]
MNLLLFLLRASKGVIALSLAAGLVSGLSGVGLIALIHAELGRTSASPSRLGLAFAGLCLVAALARVIAQASMVRIGQETVFKLCLHICRKILSAPLRRFEELDSGALVAVLTEDVLTVANGLAGVPLLGINLPIVLACLVYVGWLSPPVLVCGLLFTVPAIAVNTYLMSNGVRQLTRARTEQDVLVGHFRSLIDGFRELKLHRARRESFLDDCLRASTATVRDRNSAGLTFYALAASWGQLAFFGFIGFVLFVLPSVVDVGRQALAGATLVVLFIMSPLDVVLAWVPILGRAGISLRRIQALDPSIQTCDSPDDASAPTRSNRVEFRSAIELSGVKHIYRHANDPEGFALGPIDLTLRPEEIVFLVGGNGSGKTTLVKLISGLYASEEGTIRVDGRTVNADDLEDYRQLFTAVFADGHLFKTLLGLAPDDLDDRAARELARLEMDEHVRVERGTFSTTDLSQGQRKRLALLGALLENRPICILDEWASHQDPHFKKTFYLEILPEWRARGKTLIVISHDEDYFHVADRVIHLDSGRISAGELDVAPGQTRR